ncbi:hypothetical protein TRFO_41038 [Tritrichomonas foetus]|uniref:Uncharacterized protein n=1 Tax=Tritrichomonas foetus TaxID=1144522 RepID=A0A1J4L1I4_9EUKA|nr:hypothetical protein TRFO_41038 [Tritrichomonas foetus]|eukprot:OHT17383.1 hypothetical protein TRFO_41038 [Tritrichomonas foetus]
MSYQTFRIFYMSISMNEKENFLSLWDFNKTFVCRYATPAFGCEIYEMVGIGAFFFGASIYSIYYFVNYNKKKKIRGKNYFFDQNAFFWLTLIVWELFRFLLSLIPFPYNSSSLKIVFVGLHHIFLFIPMCFLILIVCDLLFSYRNPGTNALFFFQCLSVLFFFTFIGIAIYISFYDIDIPDDPEATLSLWAACSDLIILVFFTYPAFRLLSAIKYPMIQPDQRGCIKWHTFGIIIFDILFFLRMLYNAAHYFEINGIQKWVNEHVNNGDFKPDQQARIWNFFFYFLFDCIPTLISIIAVIQLNHHDAMFNENPYYTHENE